MTRIAIVAVSDRLRLALASAIGSDPGFEVVGVSASEAGVPASAEVIIVARSASSSPVVAGSPGGDTVVGTVLTSREREVLGLLALGLGNKQIAARLGISTNTVKTHLELLFDKLGVSSRAEAVATGVRRGLLLL